MHALRVGNHRQARCRGGGGPSATAPPLRLSRRAAARAARPSPPRASEEWKAVVDPASGRTYFWNPSTNATQWEAPPAAVAPAANPTTTPTTTTNPERGSFGAASGDQADAGAAGPSREELLADLIRAMNEDGSGMAFWEAARERRKHGVFEDSYIDWLTAKVERGGDEGEVAERVRARLVNPLLRQPAPFEL